MPHAFVCLVPPNDPNRFLCALHRALAPARKFEAFTLVRMPRCSCVHETGCGPDNDLANEVLCAQSAHSLPQSTLLALRSAARRARNDPHPLLDATHEKLYRDLATEDEHHRVAVPSMLVHTLERTSV